MNSEGSYSWQGSDQQNRLRQSRKREIRGEKGVMKVIVAKCVIVEKRVMILPRGGFEKKPDPPKGSF
jgi:hypothetical protein